MTLSVAAPPDRSEVTARAVAFVAAHRDEAELLGATLADLSNQPDAFATALTAGLERLADPDYLAGQQRVAPGIGAVHGVRWPLLAAVQRGFRTATKGDPETPLLFLADRLFRERELEAALVRLRPARADPRPRDGADLAAPAPRRPRGG